MSDIADVQYDNTDAPYERPEIWELRLEVITPDGRGYLGGAAE